MTIPLLRVAGLFIAFSFSSSFYALAMHLFTYWFSNLKRIVKAPKLFSDLCKQAMYRKSCCRVCMRLQVFFKELMPWRSLRRKERVKDHWTWCDIQQLIWWYLALFSTYHRIGLLIRVTWLILNILKLIII